jgi:hypothetical protein
MIKPVILIFPASNGKFRAETYLSPIDTVRVLFDIAVSYVRVDERNKLSKKTKIVDVDGIPVLPQNDNGYDT